MPRISIQDRILPAPQVLKASDEACVKKILGGIRAGFEVFFDGIRVDNVRDGNPQLAWRERFSNTGHRELACE